MKILSVSTSTRDGWARLAATIEHEGEKSTLYYEYADPWEPFLHEAADAFLAAVVVPAMAAKEPIEIEPPVSMRLLNGARMYVDAVAQMRVGTLHHIDIRAANPIEWSQSRSPNVGAFFSLGVDSFYTLLKSVRGLPSTSPRITHLLYMHGIEEQLSREQGIEQTEALIRSIAAEVNLSLIIGRTNLRDVFTERWGRHHGSGLASIGLSLSRGLGRIMTPSAHAYSNFRSIGSHPMLDAMWSSELTEAGTDGCERDRLHKIVDLVGRDPLSLKHLRVCLHNHGALYNCGRCQKCLRTMLTLHLLGTLDQAPTFPDEFPPALLKLIWPRGPSDQIHWTEVYDYARRVQADRRISGHLKRMLRRLEIREAVETILGGTPLAWLLWLYDRTKAGWHLLRRRVLRNEALP